MITYFFFYKHMKDPHLLSKVNCFYQSRDGQINIKNYNSLKDQLEIDSQPFKNENKLNGKIISFNLDLQNCLQRIHNMNLEPGSTKRYRLDKVSAYSSEDNKYYQTYIIY